MSTKRMTVVFYDLESGVITATAEGDPASIMAHGGAYLEVDEWRPDYDSTCRVVDGALVETPDGQ